MAFSLDMLLIASLFILFAGLVHGSIGLGFPLVATPLLSLITDIQSAILLTLIPTVLVNLISIASEGSMLSALRRFYPMALLAMLGGATGTAILLLTNTEAFKLLLATAILFYLAAQKISLGFSWIARYPVLSKITFGISAGVLGGLTNVMVPVLIIYCLELNYSKRDTIQLLNLCFLSGKIIQIVMFSLSGVFTLVEASISSLLMIAAAVALTIGINIRNRIQIEVYRKILRVFLLCLALVLIIQYGVSFLD